MVMLCEIGNLGLPCTLTLCCHSTLVGVECVGLIGMDVLGTVPVVWDGPAGVAIVGAEEFASRTSTDLEFFMRLPLITVTLNGNPGTKCIFDTGAQYGYVIDAALVSDAEDDGEIDDFNPIMGHIASAAWRANVSITDSVCIVERFGLLKGLLSETVKSAGCKAIVGLSWLSPRRVRFDPIESRLSIDTSE